MKLRAILAEIEGVAAGGGEFDQETGSSHIASQGMEVLVEVGAADETAEESDCGFNFGHARDGFPGVVGVRGVITFEAPERVGEFLAAHDDFVAKELHFFAIFL